MRPHKGFTPKKKMSSTVTGTLFLTGKDVGYVASDKHQEDIEIQPEHLDLALHGDTVKVIVKGKNRGRIQGEVSKVIEKAKQTYVGVLVQNANRLEVHADDRKMHFPITVDKKDKAEIGDKVVIEITKWKKRTENPKGNITRILGKDGEHNTEMEAIVIDNGFDTQFPQAVLDEANKVKETKWPISEKEIKNRRDFRDTLTFTIDPADAKDFDDAISFKKLNNGHIEIGVHIADVSYYVEEGTLLDREARNRAFSVYLVDRTIPMLPEVLSNDLCSLNPNVDRLTYSAAFEVDLNGNIHNRWFGRAVIHSDKRFTYEEAQKNIDAKSGEYVNELITLNNIAKKLRDKKFSKGAIDFGDSEVKFELDEDGTPLRVIKKERLDTHKLVEEYMLLANREVAEFFYNMHQKKQKPGKETPFIYRIHDLPNPEKLHNLSVFVKALGYELPIDKNKVDPKDINALLERVQGHAAEALIHTAAIRTMAKAIYTTSNIGHFGLAFEYYTHFTSPIRRYPDLIVHRMMDMCQSGKPVPQDLLETLNAISNEASELEVKAVDAERASIKLKQVEYMSARVGQTFTGTITGVTEWGMYVADDETKSEGMIKIKDLGDDYFNLDSETYSIVGEKTKKKFSLGDKVKFKVVRADLERKQLDYALAI